MVLALSNWGASATAANFATEPESLGDWLDSWRKTSPAYPWLVANRGSEVVGWVRRADLASEPARVLIQSLDAELSAQYPEPGATHFDLEPSEVVPERGGFFIAEAGEATVGCGALRALDGHRAEIKRMFVVPEWRGLGFSNAILNALESEAIRIGVRRVCLETGDRQRAAMSLYERSGYRRIAPFGKYVDSPLSVCLEKSIGGS